MLAAAESAGLHNTHVIEDIELLRPLVLSHDNACVVQVALEPDAENTWLFSAHSGETRTNANTTWTLHARSTLRPASANGSAFAADRSVIDELTRGDADVIRAADVYDALAQRGLVYGPALRGLERVWRRNGELIARIALPEALRHEMDGHSVHPALLDAALHLLAADTPSIRGADLHTFVPASCRRVRFYRRPGHALWSHAVLRRASPRNPEIEADIRLLDDSGQVIAQLTGLRLARLTSESAMATVGATRLSCIAFCPF
jgi:epothilone polyketide synthase D